MNHISIPCLSWWRLTSLCSGPELSPWWRFWAWWTLWVWGWCLLWARQSCPQPSSITLLLTVGTSAGVEAKVIESSWPWCLLCEVSMVAISSTASYWWSMQVLYYPNIVYFFKVILVLLSPLLTPLNETMSIDVVHAQHTRHVHFFTVGRVFCISFKLLLLLLASVCSILNTSSRLTFSPAAQAFLSTKNDGDL